MLQAGTQRNPTHRTTRQLCLYAKGGIAIIQSRLCPKGKPGAEGPTAGHFCRGRKAKDAHGYRSARRARRSRRLPPQKSRPHQPPERATDEASLLFWFGLTFILYNVTLKAYVDVAPLAGRFSIPPTCSVDRSTVPAPPPAPWVMAETPNARISPVSALASGGSVQE